MKDQIYSKPFQKISKFKFDARVAGVFDDMISRSVPGYRDIVQMTGVLAARYIRPKTRVYDLGCSLGAVSKAILKSVNNKLYEIIAVDSSEAMIAHAKKNLKGTGRVKVTLKCARLETLAIQEASLVVLSFVLQFIPQKDRLAILKKIIAGMIPGGALVFSEKIDFPSPHEHIFQQKLHEEFKKMKGYSKLEISQKRTALEKILIPESLAVHENRLKQAGFSEVFVWFRCFNFVSMLAIK